MNIGRSRKYLQINARSHYHVSAGSILRQEKALRQKQYKRLRAAIILVIAAIIAVVILFSIRSGDEGSSIKLAALHWVPPPSPTPLVIVEFRGGVYVKDEDPQWMPKENR